MIGQNPMGLGGLGYGQNITDLSGTRAVDTTYYNTSGRPIFVLVTAIMVSTAALAIVWNGNNILASQVSTANYTSELSFIVPIGLSYRINGANVWLINRWMELR